MVRPGDSVKNGDYLINPLYTLAIGEHLKGKVTSISDFGAFVDLGGFDGLLHISNLSWRHINHPSDIVQVGQELEVVVLYVDLATSRVSLGLKQLQPNPWETIKAKYPVNARLRGKVVRIEPYGAFVELEPGIQGLVHVSEFSWTHVVASPSDMLQVGDEVDVMVLSVNKEEQKIALSIRQTEENPWDTVADRFPVGTRVKGKVRNFTSYGAFVQLEDGIDGMIHVSDMSWTRKINHPTEVLQKGDEVEAVVLEVDSANQRISLGLKQAQEDPWMTITSHYTVGQKVKGKISKIAPFGAFIELEGGVDGLVQISQFSEERVEKGKDALKIGQEVEVCVDRIDNEKRYVCLSLREENDAENQFLDNLTRYIERCNFKYSVQDIVRFHTSVKCGMLTLVGGNPGTGKSSLVELYFRALGGKSKNASVIDTFLRIDVNPSWMEPADLLGYNDAEGKFRPASNGFWRFLRTVPQDKQEDDSLHPICLEEINLARVEHYFSDFIQMMSRGGGKISAGNNATDTIVIDDRVRFVGTCNLDETTHSMSLRLLDRCSFIELDQDEETRKQLEENIWSEPEPTPLPFEESDGVSSSTFNGWVCTASEKQISEAIRKDFSDFQTEFAGAGIAPSPRVVSDIAKYIRNRPAFNGKDVSLEEEDRQRKALDECIAQRILSRYRPSPGTIAAFRNLESKLGSLYPLSAGLAKRKDDEYKRAVSLSESWQ